jgi:SAM-dependent methyltransferase
MELSQARERLIALGTGFQGACVLAAAAELDLFTQLARKPETAEGIARSLRLDPRGLTMLLDATVALSLLEKQGERYALSPEFAPLLDDREPTSMVPMILHWSNILRQWAQLAWTVQSGIPAPKTASIRGMQADQDAFIAAMNAINAHQADALVETMRSAGLLNFEHLLDVGGASGTYTLAFCRHMEGLKATLFDLPVAIRQAETRIGDSRFADRVELVEGDFYRDPLPDCRPDFAWLSAIIHQHGREASKDLYRKVFQVLRSSGRIGIRDFVMEADRTRPVGGALFAINMLVNTDSGMTYTLEEIELDLKSVGFVEVERSIASEDMNAVVTARKP